MEERGRMHSPRCRFAWELLLCLAGRFLFAVSVNMIVTPLHLYSVGFTGIAQLMRTFCIAVLHLRLPPGLDLTGILFYLLNIPILFLAWFGVGKRFFWKTLFMISISSLFMTVVPVPEVPLMDDRLTMCIVGGVVAGVGAGIALRAGGSGGGQDVLGVYLAKKYPNMSVGIVSICTSVLIYLACVVYFDVDVLIYSFIYSTITSISLDKVHDQNIKVWVQIDTVRPGLRDELAVLLNRNIMEVSQTGNGQQTYARLSAVITKAERRQLLKAVRTADPDAFVVMNEHIHVSGKFDKPIE